MNKIILTGLLSLYGILASMAQSSSFMKAELQVKGGFPSAGGKGKIVISTYIKGDKQKIETVTDGGMQLQYIIGDKATLIDRDNKSNNVLCGEGSKEEYYKQMNEKNTETYEDLKLEKTTKTTKILGYDCKKAIIKYTQSALGFKLKHETVIWYTDQLKQNSDMINNSAGLNNSYVEALKSLGGLPLKQESYMNGSLISEMNIVQFDSKELDDSTFAIASKECKEMHSLVEFKKIIEEREAERQRQNQQFQNQMNHFPR